MWWNGGYDEAGGKVVAGLRRGERAAGREGGAEQRHVESTTSWRSLMNAVGSASFIVGRRGCVLREE